MINRKCIWKFLKFKFFHRNRSSRSERVYPNTIGQHYSQPSSPTPPVVITRAARSTTMYASTRGSNITSSTTSREDECNYLEAFEPK